MADKGNEQLQKAVNDLQKAQADILAQLKETNSKLDKVAASLEKVGSGGGGGGSTGYDTDGSKWDDGSNWNYEGKQSLAIVNTAFNKAKELKDRGDDRSFAMIFGQLSMELRRGL